MRGGKSEEGKQEDGWQPENRAFKSATKLAPQSRDALPLAALLVISSLVSRLGGIQAGTYEG